MSTQVTPKRRVATYPHTLEVRIWLPRGLGVSPNERVHWRTRSKRNADVRAAAANRAFAVRSLHPLDHVTVEFEVVWPKGARRRDDDNLVACLKPCLDGIVDGRVIASDAPGHCTLLPPLQSRDKRASIPVVIARIRTSQNQPITEEPSDHNQGEATEEPSDHNQGEATD